MLDRVVDAAQVALAAQGVALLAQAQAVQLGRIETRLDALMDQSDRILRALEAK